MKRINLCLALLIVLQGPAAGQVGNLPYNPRPAVSPYLNMLRGSNAAINYYGVVRPQIQTAQTLQHLQNQQLLLPTVQRTVPLTNDDLVDGLPSTGHPVQFMSYSHYFPQPGNRGGVSSNVGGPGSSSYMRR
jgi:hypothetical protein